MSTSSVGVFNGNSRYASDFQSIIDRSVAIASLPISQLNDNKDLLNSQSTALSALDDKFAGLQSALSAVQDALGSGSFEASISDPSVVNASIGSGAMEGAYAIEVTSLGAYSTSISPDSGVLKVTDPSTTSITTAASVSLKVGTADAITITPSTHSLTSLANAINAAGAGVRATVVNVGSASAPDYRLSVQSTKLGEIAIELKAGSTSLLTTQTTGSVATYKVNNVSTEVESDSRTVEIAPGLDVQLLAKSPQGVSTSITLTRQSSTLSDALESFATAYNAAVDGVDQHRGDAQGALHGEQIVYTLGTTLRNLSGYSSGTSGVSSLASLGLSLDKTGKFSFNSFALMAADFGGGSAVTTFLAGAGGAGGFLKAAQDALNQVEDPLTGSLKTEMASVTNEITSTDQLIADNQARVDDLKTRLQEQMAAADAAIAVMEQQYNVLSSMFESMRVAQQSMQ